MIEFGRFIAKKLKFRRKLNESIRIKRNKREVFKIF